MRAPAELVRRPGRRLGRRVARVAGVLIVWVVLLLPDAAVGPGPATFLRIPLEGILLAAVLAAVPPGAARLVAVAGGVTLALLTVGKALDVAVGASLGRPFDPFSDAGQLGPGAGVVADALHVPAALVLAGAAAVVLVSGAVLAASVLGTAALVRAVPGRSRHILGGLAAVWAVLALTGAALAPGMPVASIAGASFTASTIARAVASAQAARSFDAALRAHDPYSGRAASLARGPLAGKDVLIVFVESYGRVAVEGSSFSRGVDAALHADTRALAAAGFSARTGMLTSPTFGGISWLAHSTLQSGIWVPDQSSYDHLLATNRLTLTRAFHRSGWRTVSDVPSDTHPWPAGRRFYDFDAMLDSTNVGYAGPPFSYAAIPDQYTLAHFAQDELRPGHEPVMAEIDLVSSHTPWTPLPHLVDPAALGDGSIYDPMPAEGVPPSVAWRDPRTVRALYGQSVEYSIDALTGFVAASSDKDLVVLMLGDHQPAEIVSGPHAGHDVPVSLISADPAVLRAVDGWHWTAGLRPRTTGPTWQMDRFRDRFFAAFTGAGEEAAGPARPVVRSSDPLHALHALPQGAGHGAAHP